MQNTIKENMDDTCHMKYIDHFYQLRGENRLVTQASLPTGVLLRLLRGGIGPYEGFGVSLVHGEHTKSPINDDISVLARLSKLRSKYYDVTQTGCH